MAKPEASTPTNLVAIIGGHHIYRDGAVCHLWTPGVGWWGFDMTEEGARQACSAVAPATASSDTSA